MSSERTKNHCEKLGKKIELEFFHISLAFFLSLCSLSLPLPMTVAADPNALHGFSKPQVEKAASALLAHLRKNSKGGGGGKGNDLFEDDDELLYMVRLDCASPTFAKRAGLSRGSRFCTAKLRRKKGRHDSEGSVKCVGRR